MATELIEPGQIATPGELLSPEGADRIEQYRSDGIYEYSLGANGKRDKSRLKISYYEGEIYEGALRRRKYEGNGKYTWKNGGVYEGEFKRGHLVGKGTYATPDGGMYEGEFKHDTFNGAGKYTWADGSSVEGEFKNGQLINGRYTDTVGNVYSCKYKYKSNGERKSGIIQLIKKATYNQESREGNRAGDSTNSESEEKKSGLTSMDNGLITAIRGSKLGSKFERLYSGRAGKSEKEEEELIVILNFFTGSDAETMKRIFKSSKLYDEGKGQESITEMINRVIKGEMEFTADSRAQTRGTRRNNIAVSGADR